MLGSTNLRKLLLIGSFSLTCASESQMGIRFHYEYFSDANHVTSYTPGADIVLPISKHWTSESSIELDGVTGASRVAEVSAVDGVTQASELPNLIDGIAGASTFEFRKSQSTQLTYSNSGTVASLGYAVSSEDDYFSSSPSISFAQDFFERNTTVGFSYSYFQDKFVNAHVNALGSADKILHSAQVSLTQILTPKTLAEAGIQRIHSRGYLSKPYNPVVIPIPNPVDEELYSIVDERIPNHKDADVLSLNIVQGFHLIPDLLGSIRLGYRYYQDSWSLKSHTLQTEISQYFDDGLYVRLRYRYYNQGRAEFAYANYSGSENYLTSDIRYYPFISQLFGFKVGASIPDEWLEAYSWLPNQAYFKTDYTIRNTHGNPLLYQFYEEDDYYDQWSILIGADYEF